MGVQGVQLNAVDGAGNTALMDAIRHSHMEVQAALRAAGANLAAVNVADKLCLAAAEDDTPFLEVCCPIPPPCRPFQTPSHVHIISLPCPLAPPSCMIPLFRSFPPPGPAPFCHPVLPFPLPPTLLVLLSHTLPEPPRDLLIARDMCPCFYPLPEGPATARLS